MSESNQPAIFSMQVQCPYCGEAFEVVIDHCGENQQYIEDCQICCQPINFNILVNEMQGVQVNVSAENEA